MLEELPKDGGTPLLRMEREVRSENGLRGLVVELVEKWLSLTHHRRRPWVPSSNNVTEWATFSGKVRYKTVRGYKSESGMMNRLGLTQWVWGGYGPMPQS